MSRLKESVQNNESKHRIQQRFLIGFGLLLFVLTIGIMAGSAIYEYRVYQDTLASAESYYSEQDYKNAILEFESAFSYSYKKKEQTILDFADAYMKESRLEEAVKLIQDSGINHSSVRAKKKADEIVDQLMEQEYNDHMERGNRYERAEEYVRAVYEYLEAYRLKSTDLEVMRKIVLMYLKNKETEKAEEFLNKVGNTKEIQQLRKLVSGEYEKQKYQSLIVEAQELYCNESYTECFQVLDKAVALLPKQKEAYQELADAYIKLEQYDKAIEVISAYEKEYNYTELNELIDSIQEEKNLQINLTSLMSTLYKAFAAGDLEQVVATVHSSDYKLWIKEGEIYYYSYWDQKRVNQIPEKKGLIIYGNGCIYCGEIKNGQRVGKGRYFGITGDVLGYFLFQGSWGEDKPNGEGVLHTVMSIPYKYKKKQFIVKVQGTYRDGLENGYMKRTIYKEDEFYGSVKYQCISGIPQAEDQNEVTIDWPMKHPYVYGILTAKDGSKQSFYYNNNQQWGVPNL